MVDRIEEELLRRLERPDLDPFQELRGFLDWYRVNRPAPSSRRTAMSKALELLERYDYLFGRIYDECVPESMEADARVYADESDEIMDKLKADLAELERDRKRLDKLIEWMNLSMVYQKTFARVKITDREAIDAAIASKDVSDENGS